MRPQLIETVRVDADGRMPLLPLHLERLYASCESLGYAQSADAAARAIARTVRDLPEGKAWRLRLLASDDGRITVETSELASLTAPVHLVLATERLNSREPLLRHKTTHRPWYEHDPAWLAAHAPVFDRLYLNERDELCEGSRCNVYVRIDGQWLTPPLASGCLCGVQRQALLDDERVEEAVIHRSDLSRASGLRISNALRGWLDAVLVAV
jgi:4-amino-4-deoxychorismate lyase